MFPDIVAVKKRISLKKRISQLSPSDHARGQHLHENPQNVLHGSGWIYMSSTMKVVPYHRCVQIPRVTVVSILHYGSWLHTPYFLLIEILNLESVVIKNGKFCFVSWSSTQITVRISTSPSLYMYLSPSIASSLSSLVPPNWHVMTD